MEAHSDWDSGDYPYDDEDDFEYDDEEDEDDVPF
jgi:hypothetical protein